MNAPDTRPTLVSRAAKAEVAVTPAPCLVDLLDTVQASHGLTDAKLAAAAVVVPASPINSTSDDHIDDRSQFEGLFRTFDSAPLADTQLTASTHVEGPDYDQPLANPTDPRPLQKEPTPLLCTLESMGDTGRTLQSVTGYVIQDLADAVATPVADWLDLYLGISPAIFQEWTSKIAEGKWFEDAAIQKALTDYCSTTDEKKRYKPFVDLMNTIIEKAHKVLPLAGKEGEKYPIDDIHFVKHANKYVALIPEHGKLGAKRAPDVLLMRQSAAPVGRARAEWRDILSWFELKATRLLTPLLDSAKAARGPTGSGPNTGPDGKAPPNAPIKVRACIVPHQ